MLQNIDKINELIKITERVNKLAQKDNMSFEDKCYQLRQQYILAQQFQKAKMFGNLLNIIDYQIKLNKIEKENILNNYFIYNLSSKDLNLIIRNINNKTYDYFHKCCLNAIEQVKEEERYGYNEESLCSIVNHENMVMILAIYE